MVDYILNYSLENNKPVTIVYTKGLEISQRKIKVIKDEGELIHAYCYIRKAARNFKKENILAAMIEPTASLQQLNGHQRRFLT